MPLDEKGKPYTSLNKEQTHRLREKHGLANSKKREVAHKMKKKDDGVDMLPFMRKVASEHSNPFNLVTHINGKKIKSKS